MALIRSLCVMATVEPYTIRLANPEDDAAIARLVVEGFVDQFIPIFGGDSKVTREIMRRWVELEHSCGGVRSLVTDSGGHEDRIVASVGVRTTESQDSVLAKGLWRSLKNNLGILRAFWATTLLSHPHYSSRPDEAYVERLVVTEDYKKQGLARNLLHRAESLGRESDKTYIGLHVSGNSTPAINLYTAEGYKEVSRQRSLTTGYFLGVKEWLYLRKTL